MGVFIAKGEVIELVKSTDKAILIHNIAHWIEVNKANNKNFHDGYFWTYNSTTAFSKLFPFWTSNKIQKMLKNLENDGYLKSGNYNKIAYDRTKWYTICDSKLIDIYKLSIKKGFNLKSQTVENHKAEWLIEKSPQAQAIPDVNTDINKDIKTDNSENEFSATGLNNLEKKLEEVEVTLGMFEIWWNSYDKKTGREKTFKKFRKLSKEDQEKCLQVVEKYVQSTPEKMYRKNPLTYLNGSHWEDEIQVPESEMSFGDRVRALADKNFKNNIGF